MFFQNSLLLVRSPHPETFMKCKGGFLKTLQTGSFPKGETGRLSLATPSRGGRGQVVPRPPQSPRTVVGRMPCGRYRFQSHLWFRPHRTWRTNLPRGACALLLTSVDHDRAPVVGVRVNVLLSRYLIEPCGSGKSKLTYMCRADLRYVLILTF